MTSRFIEEIAPDDLMYEEREGYFTLAKEALGCIWLAMASAGTGKPARILDLPCGHGRVLRMFQAEYPDAELTACDIHRPGVDFCAATFGAKPVYGSEHPQGVLEDQFDLIWCGSLLTHLDAPSWREFVELFEAALAPGGLLVITTHGRGWAERLRDPDAGPSHLPDDETRRALLAEFERTGFGYVDYDLPADYRAPRSLPEHYGMSLSKPSWACGAFEQTSLRLVTFMESRWGFQDVLGFVRP